MGQKRASHVNLERVRIKRNFYYKNWSSEQNLFEHVFVLRKLGHFRRTRVGKRQGKA